MMNLRKIKLTQAQFEFLLAELSSRGGGFRESGAFLLSDRSTQNEPDQDDYQTVSTFAFYDDLDAKSLSGGIIFGATGYSVLGELCRQRDLRVIADIHTHPGRRVEQSFIDATNPMAARRGHIALIAPNYAKGRIEPSDLGVHIFEGGGVWTSWFEDDVKLALIVEPDASPLVPHRTSPRRIWDFLKFLAGNFERRKIE